MDDHISWAGNSIGARNHKFFVLFLVYAVYSLWIISMCLGYDAFATEFDLDWWVLLVTFGTFALTCALSGVMLLHLWFAVNNHSMLQIHRVYI